MTEEFKVLKTSEVRIQGLQGDEQKKCATLAQQLADVSAQLTSREETLKEVQNELQLQKERNDMFMSFVDGETNKVDICKILREVEQLQERINEQDVDRVVDSVLNDVLDNDVSELEPCVVDLKATIHSGSGKWSEVDDMRTFQIRIRYHCQISRRRITHHSPR
jgi:hypothetical protein